MAGEKVEVSVSLDVGAGISDHRRRVTSKIAMKLTKQGKIWTTSRSEDEFTNLHQTLGREFAGVLTLPPLPSSFDIIDSIQDYLDVLVNHPSIKTSASLIQFVELQVGSMKSLGREKAEPKCTKRGLLTLKDGKHKKYNVTVENRVLYCMSQNSGVCEVAMLLDTCEVFAEDDNAFSLHTKSKETNKSKRRTVLGKLSSGAGCPTAYYFIAHNREDRDEWIEAIKMAGKICKDSAFTVMGNLTVEVIEGKSLAPKDFHLIGANTSDPYVVLRIECQQAISRTIKRNLNPTWNEEFSFDITQNQGILFVLLYDEDILSRSDSMGQVVIPLSGLPSGVVYDTWLPVLPRKPYEKISGEVHLRLKYNFVKQEAGVVMGPIFGMNLQEICDNAHLSADGIPKFFTRFLSYLESNGMSEQGIFRVSGSFTQIKAIKQAVDEGKEILYENYDIHSISGALKLYLRELPVPLLTYENYNKLIEVANISSEKEMLHQLKMLVVVLPPSHVDLLKLLLPSLKRFSENNKVNMMTTTNLSIVFGPSLIRPQVDNFETVLHTVNITTLTTLLIEHNISLFQ